MKRITVFTPTYNRAYLLPRLYESLCNQTSKDFLWLVIDDGSSDDTGKLIQKWQSEKRIEIQYHYKKNGGMHTGHNAAYKVIATELNVCIDSDDYMPDDGVDKILTCWSNIKNKDKISGIVGLDATANGQVLGSRMPADITQGSYHDLYTKYKATGDKKFVLRTAEVKRFPLYPEYKNEKLVPLGILYIMMGEKKPFVFLDDVLCIVEYQEGGSSNTIFKQYMQSPRGFAYARRIGKKYSDNLFRNLIQSMHIGVSAIFANDLSLLLSGPKLYQNLLMFPFAILLAIFIKLK
ncbi:hypothetical protein OA84_04735 [Kaistella solincola]|uniref:Glycosyltransferase 2-like domain-containing protein n=1 Tax=Kaistella solincola TaxID=510955 RepID=A0ABR4ZQC2_9FLAO|nr:glycosyltransferase family 2 protein [Kaistella solincola]KIA82879.1 hypothetical protein OA84_04735 [Kaistella solincola]